MKCVGKNHTKGGLQKMKIDARKISEHEQKFLDHIKFQYPGREESVSLLHAVETAFVYSDDSIGLFDVPVVNSLVASLARCNLDSESENDQGVDENVALVGILKGLLSTALAAYYAKTLSFFNKTYFLGSFPLPSWLPKYALMVDDWFSLD
jgi:hypothetical protein